MDCHDNLILCVCVSGRAVPWSDAPSLLPSALRSVGHFIYRRRTRRCCHWIRLQRGSAKSWWWLLSARGARKPEGKKRMRGQGRIRASRKHLFLFRKRRSENKWGVWNWTKVKQSLQSQLSATYWCDVLSFFTRWLGNHTGRRRSWIHLLFQCYFQSVHVR